MVPNALDARISRALLLQRVHLSLQRPMRIVNEGGNLGKVLARGRGGQPRGCGHKGVAVLGNSKGRLHFRDAALIHAALDFTHAIERKPPDQASGHR